MILIKIKFFSIGMKSTSTGPLIFRYMQTKIIKKAAKNNHKKCNYSMLRLADTFWEQTYGSAVITFSKEISN